MQVINKMKRSSVKSVSTRLAYFGIRPGKRKNFHLIAITIWYTISGFKNTIIYCAVRSIICQAKSTKNLFKQGTLFAASLASERSTSNSSTADLEATKSSANSSARSRTSTGSPIKSCLQMKTITQSFQAREKKSCLQKKAITRCVQASQGRIPTQASSTCV